MLRERAQQHFLRLPAPTRRAVLAAIGRRAPGDPRFDHASAPDAGGPDVGGPAVGPPDVVGTDVHKAGTTWWYSLFARHPDFYSHPGAEQERDFFARFFSENIDQPDITNYRRWCSPTSGDG